MTYSIQCRLNIVELIIKDPSIMLQTNNPKEGKLDKISQHLRLLVATETAKPGWKNVWIKYPRPPNKYPPIKKLMQWNIAKGWCKIKWSKDSSFLLHDTSSICCAGNGEIPGIRKLICLFWGRFQFFLLWSCYFA